MTQRYLIFLARVTFAITLVLLPFRFRITLLERPIPPVYGDYTNFLLFLPDIAMVCALLFWFAGRTKKLWTGPSHVWVPLIGLTLSGLVSVLSSWDRSLSLYHAIRLILLIGVYLFIVNEIESPIWIVIPIALQVTVQAAVAIGQSIQQHDLGLQAFGEYLLDPTWNGVSVLEAGGLRFLRAYGLSDHPNILGGCFAFGLVVLLGAFLHQKKWYWLNGLAIIPASVGLLLTYSRSAWLALFVAGCVLIGVAIQQKNIPALMRTGVLAVLCVGAMLPFINRDLPFLAGRFNAGNTFAENRVEHGSFMEREYLFEKSNELFIDHAILGTGLGASPVSLHRAFPQFPTNYQPPHFTLLAASLEIGIIGSTFYFLLLVTPIIVFISQYRKITQHPARVTAFALLLAITVVGLFDYYTWLLVPGRLWQWTAWGLWAGAHKDHELA